MAKRRTLADILDEIAKSGRANFYRGVFYTTREQAEAILLELGLPGLSLQKAARGFFIQDRAGRKLGPAGWQAAEGPARPPAPRLEARPALHSLVDRLTARTRLAFLRAIREAQAAVDLSAFLRALELGDRFAAIEALRLTGLPKALQPVVDMLGRVFAEAGETSAAQLATQVGAVDFAFDRADPNAVVVAEKTAALRVVQISEETEQAIRSVITRAFTEGLEPAAVARQIRGLVGLTERQAQAVLNFRAALEEDEVGAEVVARQTARYAEKLLRLRSETIARTELISASTQGQLAAWRQASEEGLLDEEAMVRVWIVTDDERLCPDCNNMDGQRTPFGDPFITGAGEAIDGPTLHPNCRCTVGLEPA